MMPHPSTLEIGGCGLLCHLLDGNNLSITDKGFTHTCLLLKDFTQYYNSQDTYPHTLSPLVHVVDLLKEDHDDDDNEDNKHHYQNNSNHTSNNSRDVAGWHCLKRVTALACCIG